MKLWQPQTWSITARLVMVATVPATLMFIVVNLSLYFSGQDEVRKTIQERGQLISAALAETSQYGVVSGNTSYLERNVRQLLKTDRSIAAIEILDAERRPIVTAKESAIEGATTFERTIGAAVPDINLFDESGGPHVSLPLGASTAFRPGQTVGYVRVLMSPVPILEEKRHRLFLGGLVVLAATVISGLAGLYLAQLLRAPLAAVMGALRQIRQGEYAVRLRTLAAGELGELQAAIVEMAKALSITRREFEQQVASRTRDLQQAIDLAAEADAEKRRLIARTNALLEEERQRIAVEIHDAVNASLIVVALKAQHVASIAKLLPVDVHAAEVERTALAIAETVQDLYAVARDIVKRLRPEVIDTLGLKGALEELIRHFGDLQPACDFSLEVADGFPYLRGQLAMTGYRLVQEALTNVVKHSQANEVVVRLEPHPELPAALITVRDNGTGFDCALRPSGSLGVISMRERVSAIGGSMQIDSSPRMGTYRKGTTISFTLPTE